MSFGDVLGLLLGGLVIGALGRFAVPGPDPMPLWATIGLGVVGAFVGGGIGLSLAGPLGALAGSVTVAALLIIGYRRFVQRRPITGPDARRRPR